jgi:hypothetical protein
MFLLVKSAKIRTLQYGYVYINLKAKGLFLYNPLLYLLLASEDVGVTGIDDGKDGAVVELTAGGTKVGVVTRVVVDGGLGKHGKIFDLGLAKRGAVGGDEDHLGLALAEGLGGGLVTEDGLAGLHDQLKAGVHVLHVLLLRSRNRGECGSTEMQVRNTRYGAASATNAPNISLAHTVALPATSTERDIADKSRCLRRVNTSLKQVLPRLGLEIWTMTAWLWPR